MNPFFSNIKYYHNQYQLLILNTNTDTSWLSDLPSYPSAQRHWYSYSALAIQVPPCRQGLRSHGLPSLHWLMALLSVKLYDKSNFFPLMKTCKKKIKPKWNCLISKPKMNITYREGHSHLSYASIKQHANIGRFGQDVHAGHSSQIHGCVDIKALGLAWRGSCDFSCMVHLQGAVLIDPLRHHAMPLTQRHGLLTAQNSLTWERGGKILFSLDRIGTSHYMWPSLIQAKVSKSNEITSKVDFYHSFPYNFNLWHDITQSILKI